MEKYTWYVVGASKLTPTTYLSGLFERVREMEPKRVFTLSQIKYVADRMTWLYENRNLIGGLEFTFEPKILRFFFGRLKPVSDWPAKLAEKFRKDFGDSL